jgi:exosortase
MASSTSEPANGTRQISESSVWSVSNWIPILLSVAALIWFYGIETRFGPTREQSALGWLASAWNSETDYEHGLLFPFVIAGLLIYRFKDLKAAVGEGSLWGLLAVLVGAMLYAASYRTLQPRIAVGGLPFLLWGAGWYLYGWRVAKLLLFPLFFFWLAVPLPTFQQATVQLQIIATSMTHSLSGLLGVETYYQGTEIFSKTGNWEPLSIAGGCSGIRSLMALLMISAAWAYVARIALWKKALLFLSAVPLAILGNVLRVTSIFVIAEYGDAKWARETWHDWSGLLLFYPISLFMLLVLHSVLEGGLPWRKGKRRELRQVIVKRVEASNTSSESP